MGEVLDFDVCGRGMQAWVRRRARQGGMPQPSAVMLVSAVKGTGVDQLLIQLHLEVGASGDVWVVSVLSHISSQYKHATLAI